MESSLIGLELVHEHRNYLPIFGPVVGLCYGASSASKYIRTPLLKTALWVMVALTLGFSTHALAKVWSDKQTLVQFMVWHHPDSARAHATLAEFQLQERQQPLEAIIRYEQAARLAPHETAYLIQVARIGAYLNARMADFGQFHGGEAGKTRSNSPVYLEVDRSSNPPGILLDDKIHRTIAEKLQKHPVHARTVTSLMLVSECIRQHPAICGHLLRTATSWHRIALDNSMTDANRAALIMGLVGLMVSQGNLDEAIRLGKLARQYKPEAVGIAIMQADVYFQAGMREEAIAIIQELQRERPLLSSDDRAQIRNLLNRMGNGRDKHSDAHGLLHPGNSMNG
jgi:tetratricopeptide (TPR) repeat protein